MNARAFSIWSRSKFNARRARRICTRASEIAVACRSSTSRGPFFQKRHNEARFLVCRSRPDDETAGQWRQASNQASSLLSIAEWPRSLPGDGTSARMGSPRDRAGGPMVEIAACARFRPIADVHCLYADDGSALATASSSALSWRPSRRCVPRREARGLGTPQRSGCSRSRSRRCASAAGSPEGYRDTASLACPAPALTTVCGDRRARRGGIAGSCCRRQITAADRRRLPANPISCSRSATAAPRSAPGRARRSLAHASGARALSHDSKAAAGLPQMDLGSFGAGQGGKRSSSPRPGPSVCENQWMDGTRRSRHPSRAVDHLSIGQGKAL